ncbi:hypothetical protein [Xanthomonas euvesicatoria]|uniref:hypothetical protein n=1 Tax=Xanthomonas euvesicatoria TaxID=456327 RepID=UPI001C47ACC8|nr:hypothetical protein [Xanthomonas euvesicatoria]MBV6884178.1 hypothetical protein [Xanthomonas campestris pv. euphorbiae]
MTKTDSNESITITSIPTPTLSETTAKKEVIILPVLASLESGRPAYASTSISLKKYADRQVEIDFLTPMDDLYDQRSATIYLPPLLFVAHAVFENQELIKTTLDIIIAFLKDSGKSEDAPVELSCIVEEAEGSRSVKLDYKGPVKGLSDVAPALKEAVRRGK